MKTSRLRLLDYIRDRRLVTTAEISKAFRMTQANARHHLEVLRELGLVEVVGQRSQKGKGRPAWLYGLSERTLGHNLDNLTNALLAEISRESDLRATLQRIAYRMTSASDPVINDATGQPVPTMSPGKRSLTHQLYEVIQRLNNWNYQARWEAHTEAPHIVLGHCPYAAILPEHPELCQLDANLLEILIGAPVSQTSKQVPDSQGIPQCVFHLLHSRARQD